jgi:hypothetical protein
MSLNESTVRASRATRVRVLPIESAISEISVAPDGRVLVFGASRAVLEAIKACGCGGSELAQRLDRLRPSEPKRVYSNSIAVDHE